MKISLLITVTLSLVINSFLSFSQEIYTGKEANNKIKNTRIIRDSQFSTLPSYIGFQPGKELDLDTSFEWLKKNFNLSSKVSLQLVKTDKDQLGYTHYRYQELFDGKKIEGAIWILHVQNDKVHSMNGLLYNNLINTGAIAISEEFALTVAKEYVGASLYKWEILEEEKHLKWESGDESASYFPSGELMYVANKFNYKSYRLAYRFDIYAHAPISRSFIYVDVETGTVISQNNIIHDVDTPGTANTGYSGTQTITTDDTGSGFRLQETGRGNGIRTFNMNQGTNYGSAVDFTDADNIWNNVNAQFDEYATDAHWGAEMTYDYFLNMHGRNSIDGAGFQLNSYVHYDAGFNNAFWDGTRMTYGDGNGNPLTSLDIAGHEITHGLTTNTANLVYQDEPGALNESFSDIFGTSIENFARPGNWNWTIGEDLGSAFRSMSNPNSRNDPDTYFGTFWAPLGGADNGGVHTNSGVQNFWYYLLTTGGTGTNDNGDAYNVTGLSFTKSSAITFRSLTVYLTQNSQYSDARFYAILSAMDLYGACTPEVESTTNAWFAVGVGAVYNPTVIADFSAPITASCSAPFTVNFSNLSNNAGAFSWDFGDGGTSSQNSPSYTYLTSGTFDVQLIASGGSCGTDTTIYTTYITIDVNLPCVVVLPGNGTADLQTACAGTMYDPGGPSSPYSANQDAQITISPTGAATVDLAMTLFDIEPGSTGATCDYDFVEVYDGNSIGAALIGKYCNNNPPPATISSSSGSITVVFHSDPGVENAGFQIDWQCIISNQPPVANFTVNTDTTCTGIVGFSDLSTNGPTSWFWGFGDGNTSTLQNPTNTYTNNGSYTVTLNATNPNGSNQLIQTNYIFVNAPPAPSATGDAICENNTATLTAVGGNLNWYTTMSGGANIGIGNSFTTPVLVATTNYYVEEEVLATPVNVGPTDNSFAGGGYFSGDQYLIFNSMAPFTLNSVWVDAGSAGNRTIELRDNAGVVLQTAVVNIPVGQSRVTLNFAVPIGTNLQLGTQVGSSPDLYRNNTGPIFPYTIGGLVSITSSSAGNGFYYHFYDWEVQEASCLSLRTLVTAAVTPQADATITPVGALCASDAAVNLVAAQGGGAWSGPGVTGSTFDPSAAGVGNHTVTYTIPGICGATDTEIIAVSNAFNATITPQASLCTGDAPLNLSAVDFGGTWSGNGITDGINGTFDPSIAGVGTHTITYTITGSCGDVGTEVIFVVATPDATITPQANVCSADTPLTLSAASTGGAWSGIGIIDAVNGVFDPSTAGVGTQTITYTISGSCPNFDTESITVTMTPDASFTGSTAMCDYNSPIIFSPATAGGVWSATCGTCINSTTGEFNPSTAGIGTWNITYDVTSGGCTNSSSSNITVDGCASITETNLNEILVYPNPTKYQVTIQTGELKSGNIKILDNIGKVILTSAFENGITSIKLPSAISGGTYFVQILSQENRLFGVARLIVN